MTAVLAKNVLSGRQKKPAGLLKKSEKIFLVADDVYENYIEYLEGLGTERSHVQLEDMHGDIMGEFFIATLEIDEGTNTATVNIGTDVVTADQTGDPANLDIFTDFGHQGLSSLLLLRS